jgi:hypothetical protein
MIKGGACGADELFEGRAPCDSGATHEEAHMSSILRRSGAAAIALAGLCVLTAGDPAAAAFRCNKGFQNVQGSEIATPYCQDEYLAEVAREYGIRTSGARIRRDWGHKRQVCRLIGQDIRIQNACVGEQEYRGRRF